jgi:photosystem II PsbY protein
LGCIFLYRQEKQNFKIPKKFKGGILTMDMDWRVLIVLVPVLIAGSWAIYNIGAIALRQAQQFLSKNT